MVFKWLRSWWVSVEQFEAKLSEIDNLETADQIAALSSLLTELENLLNQ
jgi:hypothetical protein